MQLTEWCAGGTAASSEGAVAALYPCEDGAPESNIPAAAVQSHESKDELGEELDLLQKQLFTVLTCNDASRARLRRCASAAMQRQQLLWRKWRYWYEVDRHYRWRQRMSQVHKLIIKTRSNKRDTRKVAERCAVSGLNHADKHLAEYAHGWRPEHLAEHTGGGPGGRQDQRPSEL